mmetsp:Transcript_4577/g.6942  ORF Transcript_4577/g.6942 Transcript_4577/m.6942 type:complete len:211 (-) Transcript_4577:1881-2513(-)
MRNRSLCLLRRNERIAAFSKSCSRIRWLSSCSCLTLRSSASFSSSSCSFVKSCQILIVESQPPVRRRMVLLKVGSSSSSSASICSMCSKISRVQILSSCISKVLTHCFFFIFQILTTPSTEAEAICMPMLIHRALTSWSWCPWRVAMHRCFSTPDSMSWRSQTLMKLSPLTVTSCLSEGLNWRSQMFFLWPLSWPSWWRSFDLQILIDLS